jgi:hypothetical protein
LVSEVGSDMYPLPPNGFRFWILPMREGDEVFTGTSWSLLLHPSELIESRNELDAMFAAQTAQCCS